VTPRRENLRYLQTKKNKLGHMLNLDDADEVAGEEEGEESERD
jgi:hypothetical protein